MMTESRDQIRKKITEEFLKNAGCFGWNIFTLNKASKEVSFDQNTSLRVFPGGVPEVTDYFAKGSDQRMLKELKKIDLEALRIRDRIHSCVKIRIKVNTQYREAIRRLLSFLIIPKHSPLGVRLAWRTASEMWYASGDKSTDWNYYTKRGLLASVYSTTVMYWLSDWPDDAGDYPKTWEFLDRRINNVLDIFTLPKRITKLVRDKGCDLGSSTDEQK